MTGYTILCACGHAVRASLPPVLDMQDGRNVTVRMRSCCLDCARVETKQGRTIRVKRMNGQLAEELSLLSGSAYQIAWAEDIRTQSIRTFSAFVERFPSDTRQTLRNMVLKVMNQQTKSGWWIENQNNIFGALSIKCADPLEAAILEMIRSYVKGATRLSQGAHGVH